MKNKLQLIVASLTILLVCGCKEVAKVSNTDVKPINQQQLLNNPFAFAESINEFQANMPHGTRVQKMTIKNDRSVNAPDTIYRFAYKKSEVLMFRNTKNREQLLAANIVNKEIVLTNGIRVGLTREELAQHLEIPVNTTKDTLLVKVTEIPRTMWLYFSKNKLKQVKFSVSK